MATLAQIEAALRAADASGATEDAAKLAAAYKEMKAKESPVPAATNDIPKSTVRGVPSAADNFDPTAGMSQIEKFNAGLGSGMTDLWQGVKGFAARRGLGDPAAVAAAQAEKEKYDAPLTKTVAGGLGHFAGENLPYMIPGGAVLKATQGMKLLPRLAAGTGAGAALGAQQAQLSPTTDPNANDIERAKSGAKWGAAGNIAGEGVGKVLGGLAQKASPYAQSMVDTLENSPLGSKLNLLATDLTDSPAVKSATDALSKLWGYGAPINKARAANAAALTEARTTGMGAPMPALLPEKVGANWQRLGDEGNAFRAGPDVPVHGVNTATADLEKKLAEYAAATAQPGLVRPLTAARQATAAPTPSLPTAGSIAGVQPPPPFLPQNIVGPPTPKMMTADQVMDYRRAASALAHKTVDDPVAAAQFSKLRDEYDDALKNTLPGEGPANFDRWRNQWGRAEEVEKAAKKGLTPGGALTPEAIAAGLPSRVQGSSLGTPEENFFHAASQRMLPAPGGENRSWWTSAILGGGLGYLGDKVAENPVGGVAGATIPYVVAKMLTGKGGRMLTGNLPRQQEASELARLLLQQGIQSRGGK